MNTYFETAFPMLAENQLRLHELGYITLHKVLIRIQYGEKREAKIYKQQHIAQSPFLIIVEINISYDVADVIKQMSNPENKEED